MTKGVWIDPKPGARAKAARKGAAHRKGKPRGPYGSRVLSEADSEAMRKIAARIGAGPFLRAAQALPTPGEVAARIDAVLGALDARDGEAGQ